MNHITKLLTNLDNDLPKDRSMDKAIFSLRLNSFRDSLLAYNLDKPIVMPLTRAMLKPRTISSPNNISKLFKRPISSPMHLNGSTSIKPAIVDPMTVYELLGVSLIMAMLYLMLDFALRSV